MSETVFYVRGEFPFGVARGISDQLILDTKAILSLAPDELTSLANVIDAHPGFLGKAEILKIVASRISNKSQAEQVSRLISGLDEILRATNETVEGFWGRIEESSKGEKPLLSQPEINELRTRLPLIIKAYHGLERQAKARRLAEMTGSHLEDVQLICDLRPVFDKNRDIVEGMIPYTTLRVVCKGADGLPIQMEALLSERQVAELAKKALGAEQKLKLLREMLAKKGFAIPVTNLTKQGE